MTRTVSPDQMLAIERLLLRTLCAGSVMPTKREEIRAVLRHHRFRSVIHQEIFDALTEMKSLPPESIHEELPALLTRRGFPEVDFDEFLSKPESTTGEIAKHLDVLKTQGESGNS